MSHEPETTRPNIPFNLMSAEEGAGLIPWQRAIEKLIAARTYWICTTRPNGKPQSVPMWGLWLDDTLYFRTNPYTKTVRNLRENPCLLIHLDSGQDVVSFEGEARQVFDGPELTRVKEHYDAKYQFPLPTPLWFALKPRVGHCYLCQDVGLEGANEYRGSATLYRWHDAD